MHRLLTCALVAAISFVPVANAATVALNPTDDVYTYSGHPDTNYGNSAVLATNLHSYNQLEFSYLKFDLSGLPTGQAIVGATLNLYQAGGAGSGESGVSLYRIGDDSWNEGTVTWNNPPATTGATFLATNPNGYTYVGWSQWDLFASGGWNPAVDRTDGVLSLWLAEASSNDQAHLWCSKEAATDTSGYCSAGLEPYLQVTTSPVPVPATAWLFSSGLLGLLGILRAKRNGP